MSIARSACKTGAIDAPRSCKIWRYIDIDKAKVKDGMYIAIYSSATLIFIIYYNSFIYYIYDIYNINDQTLSLTYYVHVVFHNCLCDSDCHIFIYWYLLRNRFLFVSLIDIAWIWMLNTSGNTNTIYMRGWVSIWICLT